MTKQYEKFLETLEGNTRQHFFNALQAISQDRFENFDMKKLVGSDLYRIRIGKRRIIFRRESSGNTVLKIESRGNVYKGL
ncbi:MAG: hypothetical protein ACD_80C00047G0002 [uncultured bacterium (gcode 4)]|uniref:Type II toxin-antitoxin system RelE/ParE family toxin n=1 Tax=uncultured bacterium (gcode 4) TaxID=1234023 RepID=K1XJU2_9BACT|nr:MAG: hypothetical protein ACD_80C00047G0002 [uncultured bacterium (gcode 4)]